LFFEAGLSIRAIARRIQASPATVGDYIRRAQGAGLGWPLPDELDERALEALLFPRRAAPKPTLPLPDWRHVHTELRRKGVTLSLLWQEYKAEHPDGLQYSWFCQRYRNWSGRVDLVMRQTHRAGEKLFVDYAGHTVAVVQRNTGEVREAQIFVAVLGASNYTFAEATWTQSLPDWCASHVRALHFIGGVPELVVPDNLRSAVTKAHRYEPDNNPTYTDLAEHYGFAILPARVPPTS
jgi:transposase